MRPLEQIVQWKLNENATFFEEENQRENIYSKVKR